jgi:hypothetical protein
VLLGHVDSYAGPGVFFYLRDLRRGALVEVQLRSDSTAVFRVDRVALFDKSHFPARAVYTATGRALNLVTCGGTFNTATGSYESNVVVFTHFIGQLRHSIARVS